MSNITALQAPGTGAVQPAKPTVAAVPDASKPSFTPAAGAVSVDSSKGLGGKGLAGKESASKDPVGKDRASVPSFPSPTTRIDPQINAVILEYRDGASGEVVRQLPTKAQLRLYTLNQDAKAHEAAQGPVARAIPQGPAGADTLAGGAATGPVIGVASPALGSTAGSTSGTVVTL